MIFECIISFFYWFYKVSKNSIFYIIIYWVSDFFTITFKFFYKCSLTIVFVMSGHEHSTPILSFFGYMLGLVLKSTYITLWTIWKRFNFYLYNVFFCILSEVLHRIPCPYFLFYVSFYIRNEIGKLIKLIYWIFFLCKVHLLSLFLHTFN